MPLTTQDIKNSPPAYEKYRLTDSNGLYLLVSPFGTRTWYYRYRHKGREKNLSLGRYPDVGLTAARLARNDAQKMVASGIDPVWERKRKRQEDRRSATETFRKLGDEWLDENGPLWSQANASVSEIASDMTVIRILSGNRPLLFPHARTWREPMSDAAISGMYKRMAAGAFKNRMVPHGWRSAFRRQRSAYFSTSSSKS